MRLKNISETHFETIPVNVYDIVTKQIVFTGSQTDAAKFIGTTLKNLNRSLSIKSKIKKRFAVRIAV